MHVKLIGYTSDPEKLPAMAATLTHSKTKPEDLQEMPLKKQVAILEQVLKLGHTSVLEHAAFTFAISDVSRSLTHQLVRHRIASYSQQSQRYVNLNVPNYVIPPLIAKNKKTKQPYEHTMQAIWEHYNNLLTLDIPAEDARYVLPNATCTNIMVTMNARSLLNFFELRCCLHAKRPAKEFFAKAASFARDFTDKYHHFKEEYILFNRLAMHKKGEIDAEVDALKFQHERGRALMGDVAKALEGYGEGKEAQTMILLESLAAYTSLMRQHIHKEDHIFFPLVEKGIPLEEHHALLEIFQDEGKKMGENFLEKSKRDLYEFGRQLLA